MKEHSLVKGTINCEMKKLPLSIRFKGDVNKVNFFMSFNEPISLEKNELVYSNKREIVIKEDYTDKLLANKNTKPRINFIMQSYLEKEVTVKVTFKGIFHNNSASLLKTKSGKERRDLYNYDQYYGMRLWIPDRVKQ